MLWSKSMKLIDANVILRYLLNDNPEMAEKAKNIVENGAYTKPEIIAEVVYVLKGVYRVTRAEIQIFLQSMLNAVYCTQQAAVTYALDVYADTSLDFVDCLLIAYHVLNKEDVFAFDAKLAKRLSEQL